MPPRRPPIEMHAVEAASLRAHVVQAVGDADTLGRRMRDVAGALAGGVAATSADAGPDELRAAANGVRSGALYVLTLTGELLALAGRLEQVAAVYEASGREA